MVVALDWVVGVAPQITFHFPYHIGASGKDEKFAVAVGVTQIGLHAVYARKQVLVYIGVDAYAVIIKKVGDTARAGESGLVGGAVYERFDVAVGQSVPI